LPRRLAALLVSVLALLPAAPVWADSGPGNVGQCPPGLGIGLLQVPRSTMKDPRARNYVIDSVHPGATFSREFEVCNGTTKPLEVSLYPDSAAIVQGAFTLAPGRGTNDLTSWMTVTPATLTVPTGKAVTALMSFTVPADASSGERYGGVVADAPPASNGGVAIGGRVGIRVYLDVSTGGAPKSDFTVDSLQAIRQADGTPAVLAQVHNIGARALDLRGSLQLTNGPGGLSAGPFPAKLGTTLGPGDTAPVMVPLDKAIRGGPWHAVVDMTSGLLERKAAGDITFPDQPATANAPVQAKALPLYKDRSVVVPVAIVLAGIPLLILLLMLLLRRRKRRRERA
jgi:hypothetical protein